MNSIKANLFQFQRGLAITPEVYLANLPQNPGYPVTMFEVISDVPIAHTYEDQTLCFRRARVQLEVYALTVGEAESAMEGYVAAIGNYRRSIGDGLSPESFADVSIRDAGSNPDMDFQEEASLRMIQGRSRDFRVLY